MLVILTEPLSDNFLYYWYNKTKAFAAALLKRRSWRSLKYGGHYGVTRSLICGLKKNSVDFRLNPRSIKTAETVWVLSSIEALQQAILFKQKNKTVKILAGPNLVITPQDNTLISALDINKVIVPSDWVGKLYSAIAPDIKEKILLWPAGVDTDFWYHQNKTKNKVLIYDKLSDDALLSDTLDVLKKNGYDDFFIIRYGQYSANEYKEALKNSLFSVVLDKTESEGLFLLESWSMDVPTFCLEYKAFRYKDIVFNDASSAPYLNDEVGRFWTNVTELDTLIKEFGDNKNIFSARKWLVNNLSDQKIVEKILPYV